MKLKKKLFTYILFFASSSDWPRRVKNDTSCLATPIPADPAPKKRILWSSRGVPEAVEEIFAALMKPERTTAPDMIGDRTSLDMITKILPVPWILTHEKGQKQYHAKKTQDRLTSSLNTRYLDLNMSRYRKALSVEKSSNCTKSRGNTSFIESTNSCIKPSIWSKPVWLRTKIQTRKRIPLVCLDACGVHQGTENHRVISGCLYPGQDRWALYSLVWYQRL